MIIKECVSRAELEAMAINKTRIFCLTKGGKVKSAMVTCNQLKNEKGLNFETHPDYDVPAMCIIRRK